MAVGEVIVAAVSGVCGVAASIGAAVLTGRTAQRASHETEELQAKALDVERNDKFMQRLLERLDQVEEDNGLLAARAREVDAEARAFERRCMRLERYAQTLRESIQQLGHAAPEPPHGVSLDK